MTQIYAVIGALGLDCFHMRSDAFLEYIWQGYSLILFQKIKTPTFLAKIAELFEFRKLRNLIETQTHQFQYKLGF